MRIEALDHLVLTVRDIPAAVRFYERVLGMEARTFGDGRVALHYGVQKINLHAATAPIQSHAAVPQPGSADLCFLTTEPPEAVVAHLAHHGVQIIEGPVPRTGAQGPLISVYCRDPDGNLIEISHPVVI